MNETASSPPRVIGWLDAATPEAVAGWAAIPGEARPVEVEILLDGTVVGTCRANRPRPDLGHRGDVHPNAGFELPCDLLGASYTARVSARIVGSTEFLRGSERFVQPPQGKRFFFIHIPKTAGSTINTIARLLCPRAKDHLENTTRQNPNWRDADYFSGYNFLSGHLSSRQPVELYRPHGFHFFTMFRDPAEQFVSHLRWLRHYAKYEKEQAQRLIDPLNLDIAHVLDAAPPGLATQVDCLRALLQDPRLAPAVRSLFDNSLTRYMVTVSAARMADSTDAEEAQRALRDFDVIGLQSEFNESLAQLERATGLPWTAHADRWDNSSPDNEVSAEAGAAAEVAREFVWSDLLLYRHAVARFRLATRPRLATHPGLAPV